MLEDAAGGRGMTVGQDQQRRALEAGTRHAVDDGRHAGTEGREADAGAAGDFGLRHGGERRAGFRGREDERHAGAAGGRDEIEIAAAARHPEDEADAGFAQAGEDDSRRSSALGARFGLYIDAARRLRRRTRRSLKASRSTCPADRDPTYPTHF